MTDPCRIWVQVLGLLVIVPGVGCPGTIHRPGGAAGTPSVPSRLLVIVIDQCRADYVDRARLETLQALRRSAAHFPNAYVGHLASSTVMSHGVIPRGVFPRTLGYVDELYQDHLGVLGEKGRLWDVTELGLAEHRKVMNPRVPSVAQAFAGSGRVFVVGQKRHAVQALAGREADVAVHLSDPLDARGPEGAAWAGWIRPAGLAVPGYLLGATGSRFWLDGRPTYGTERNPYGLGGHKFVPGPDPRHRGGDVWVVDAALEIMARERWGVLLVTLGGVDRVGHMMGADHDLVTPNPTPVRMASQLRTADAQVGRLLTALEQRGLAKETLVVITGDHAGMHGQRLVGRTTPGGAAASWQWRKPAPGQPPPDPVPEIAHLVAPGGVLGSAHDTAIRIWLEPGAASAPEILRRLGQLPGVIATYQRRCAGDACRFVPVREDFSRLSPGERAFHEAHARELLDTMATPSGPDLVGLLDDRTTYGTLGDHGGAQAAVQRIPYLIQGPGVKRGRYDRAARLVDLAPTVWALRHRRPPAILDGRPLCEIVASSPACRR